MNVDSKLLVELLKTFVWPAIAVIALYMLRRPLSDLLGQIARRAHKLSIYEVSVELAALPELPSSWSAGADDVRQLTSSQVFDSYSQSLFNELLNPLSAEYSLADLGAGNRWLTSRLYIFALVLGEARGLRAFVFLENANGVRRRFLGTATPADIRKALAINYPWLEEAASKALAEHYTAIATAANSVTSQFSNQPAVLFGADQNAISSFVRRFIEHIQRNTAPPPQETSSYLTFESSETPSTKWERTRWIDGERLERDLSGVLKFSYCEESLDKPENDLAEAIVRRPDQFVAIVDADRHFLRLVDRNEVMGMMLKQAKSKPQAKAE